METTKVEKSPQNRFDILLPSSQAHTIFMRPTMRGVGEKR